MILIALVLFFKYLFLVEVAKACRLEILIYKAVKVSVHNRVDVTHLIVGTMVLNKIVRMKYIRANLASPAYLLLLSFDVTVLFHILTLFYLHEFGIKHLHSHILILVLAAFVLTRNNYTGRYMGYSDSRRCFINMLTACTTGSVCVYTQVVHVDIYLYILVKLRHNIC